MRPRSLWVICLAVCLGGCASVGPNYRRPLVAAPAQWTESQEQAGLTVALEETAWWQAFDDHRLNTLMKEAARSNLDLEQARARLKQARADVKEAGAAALPSVQATGSLTRSEGGINTVTTGSAAPESLTAMPGTIFQAGFDASWEIDVFGGTRRSMEAARGRRRGRAGHPADAPGGRRQELCRPAGQPGPTGNYPSQRGCPTGDR